MDLEAVVEYWCIVCEQYNPGGLLGELENSTFWWLVLEIVVVVGMWLKGKVF